VIAAVACMESGGVDFSSRLPAGRAEAAVFAPQPASSAASKAASSEETACTHPESVTFYC